MWHRCGEENLKIVRFALALTCRTVRNNLKLPGFENSVEIVTSSNLGRSLLVAMARSSCSTYTDTYFYNKQVTEEKKFTKDFDSKHVSYRLDP